MKILLLLLFLSSITTYSQIRFDKSIEYKNVIWKNQQQIKFNGFPYVYNGDRILYRINIADKVDVLPSITSRNNFNEFRLGLDLVFNFKEESYVRYRIEKYLHNDYFRHRIKVKFIENYKSILFGFTYEMLYIHGFNYINNRLFAVLSYKVDNAIQPSICLGYIDSDLTAWIKINFILNEKKSIQ